MSSENTTQSLKSIYDHLSLLYQHALDAEKEYAADLQAIPQEWKNSARNLVHYLALRRHDIRPLQIQLSFLGLSSLGRLEAHVLAGIESVLFALKRMADVPFDSGSDRPEPLDFKEGDQSLTQHTTSLLGSPNSERLVRIMVTMPSEAAEDYALVRQLVEAGMDVMRINSAHDNEQIWEKMVQHARRAAEETKRSCRILFDLCGPKLRTGALEPGMAVVHFQPKRDARGMIVTPALVWIGSTPPSDQDKTASAVIPVDQGLMKALQPGDLIQFTDIPGRIRKITILERGADGAWGESRQSAYLEKNLPLQLVRNGEVVASGTVGLLPSLGSFILLSAGDTLTLTPEDQLGRPAKQGSDGSIVEPARIPCTLPQVFADVKPGEPILFDDGKFSGTVQEASAQGLKVIIDRAPPGGAKLRSDKGINLPETKFSLPALSPDDLVHLDFAAEHVDLVGLSFVSEPSDLFQLQEELKQRGKSELGVILKIENRIAFENLPQLLLAGLREPPFGVMVARGDLGVELGFERLAEVQEQILWLCEAAHIPVIWATQVLESLAKKGMPSRAEVTDAAMSSRAECVMLNKGPFVLQTVEFLVRILARMRDHHHKKTPMLRKLKVSEGRFRNSEP
ncbi:MAG: pyruvate kinase [SAR324 cluster bacterium]|nr:pyruvate kinase [SAR324 cluster bacterium]